MQTPTFNISVEEFEEEWEDSFRQVFYLPDNVPEGERRDWPIFPDPVFKERYQQAFLDDRQDKELRALFRDPSLFAQLQQFLKSIGEEQFALLLIPYPDHQGLSCYSFPVDVDWKTFRDTPANGMRLSTVSTSFPYLMTGLTKRWGFYYLMQWNIHIVGCADQAVLEALQDSFGIQGRNEEAAKNIVEYVEDDNDLSIHGDELRARQARRLQELVEEISEKE